MNIIVTGGAGFIGYHCARALLRRGDRVAVIDNINDYYNPALKQARLKRLQDDGLVDFHHIGLEDADAVHRVFNQFHPEQVLHLAAQAGVRYSIDHPSVYIQSNLVGTANILEACRHHGVRRLVYASSSSVYGGNTKLPFAVSDRVDQPISLYAATKKSTELMAHAYSHLYGLQTIGLRFFTVYGPWGRPDMALWLFADAILKDRPINVFNHGDMLRDFTFIDDIVGGVLGCIDTAHMAQYDIFNLGNHRCEKLGYMIELIEDYLGKKAIRNLMGMQDGDVKATYADVAHAKEVFGFDPVTPISEGIPVFLEWFLRHPEYHSSA